MPPTPQKMHFQSSRGDSLPFSQHEVLQLHSGKDFSRWEQPRVAVPCYCMTFSGTLKKRLYRSFLGRLQNKPVSQRHTLMQEAPGDLACFQEVATCYPGFALRSSGYCHPNDRIEGRREAFIPVLSKPAHLVLARLPLSSSLSLWCIQACGDRSSLCSISPAFWLGSLRTYLIMLGKKKKTEQNKTKPKGFVPANIDGSKMLAYYLHSTMHSACYSGKL